MQYILLIDVVSVRQ